MADAWHASALTTSSIRRTPIKVLGAPGYGYGLIASLAFLVSGCVSPAPLESSGLVGNAQNQTSSSCDDALNTIRLGMTNAKVSDAQDRPIPGFAFLRVNRFLASIGRQFQNGRTGPEFEAWVDRLQELEHEGLRIEIANLPATDRRRLSQALAGEKATRSDIIRRAKSCGRWARKRYLSTNDGRRRLVGAAHVADNYSDAAQLLGAYPITSIPVSQGWQRWKAKNLASFRQPLSEQPVIGRLMEFGPPPSTAMLRRHEIRSLLIQSRRSPLGIPEPRGAALRRLLHTFAPIWQLDVAGNYDRPGFPTWRPGAENVFIDVKRPVTFARASHAILYSNVYLQLNYAIWFQRRPSTGPFDLLSGQLDGVVWRVTIGDDGRPLIFDSIHLCGCYHFIFPVTTRHTKWQAERNPALNEVPAVVSGLAPPGNGQRVTLRFASGSHYLLAAASTNRQSKTIPRRAYSITDETVLRSMPISDTQRRSLYRSDGLIAGTERLERFVLWPTGVTSPGALRQWGHHAIAFADRRHFDDPGLFDTIFGN